MHVRVVSCWQLEAQHNRQHTHLVEIKQQGAKEHIRLIQRCRHSVCCKPRLEDVTVTEHLLVFGVSKNVLRRQAEAVQEAALTRRETQTVL